MGNFDRGGNKGGGFNKGGFGGKPSFQKKSWGNDSDRETMMHKATCAECSKTCEVPFRPTSGKPVFCNDCFNGQRDSNDSRGGRPSFNDRAPKRDFGGDRPSFRSEDRPSFKAAPAVDNKRELAEISMKLDRLISVMEKMAGGATAPKEKAVEKTAEAPKVAEKKAEVKKAPAKAAKPAVKKVEAKKAPAKKVVAKKKK